ncbi:MAG: hypothetical protein WC814_00230 [Candidatus Paceibacterota bacterium]|jgi:hypothetical protein
MKEQPGTALGRKPARRRSFIDTSLVKDIVKDTLWISYRDVLYRGIIRYVAIINRIMNEAPGSGEWMREQRANSPEFHPDPSKEGDPAEDLLRREGTEGAIDTLREELRKNPGNAEAQRQLTLIETRLEDLLKRIRGRVH